VKGNCSAQNFDGQQQRASYKPRRVDKLEHL